MKDHIIHAHNVSVTLNNKKILKDLTFEIPHKSIVAIIGPNGSGKTTLLKAMLGLVPYTGSIEITTKKIGYVPQRFEYDKTIPMTVNEFLRLFTDVHESEKNIIEKLTEVGLRKKENNQIGFLSGGELQRLLIAKALLNDPDILFFDEPASGIDMEGEKNFYELIHHLNVDHDKTIIMVSHEIEMVTDVATMVLCLSGSLICSGPPKKTLTKETLNKLFGDEMALHSHTH